MRAFKSLAVLAVLITAAACSPCRKAQTIVPPAFAGKVWQLEAINGAAHSNIDGMNYTLNFGTDGRITGRADCNQFFGTYNYLSSKSSGRINVGQLGTTRMMCPNQQSDDEYLAMMQLIVRAQMSGDQLRVTLSDGKTLTYRAR